MVTLETTLGHVHDWAVDRIHHLCETDDTFMLDDAFAIQSEFSEWLDPRIENHDIFSLEYMGDDGYGGDIKGL